MEEKKFNDAAEGYVDFFHRIGIDYVFSSPGTEFVPIWEYLAKYNYHGKKPFYINTRHEGAALTMAKGYTMATGKPQVVLTHVLVGLLHGAMEVRALYTDNIPAVIITGQTWTHDEEIFGGTPGPHYLSFTQVGGQQILVQSYIKWGENPTSNINILGVIARAFNIAKADIKGPVLLSLSRELAFEKNAKMRVPKKLTQPTRIQAKHKELKALTNQLREAHNPIIYTRYLGRNQNAVHSLVKLAKLLCAPVFETPGYSNFPTDNPFHMGYDITPYITESDLLLVIDSSSWPPWYPPSSIYDSTDAKIIFIDLDPLQMKYPSFGYPSDMLITADSELAITELIKQLTPNLVDSKDIRKEGYVKWKTEHQRLRDEWEKEALRVKDDIPIDSRWLCFNINEVIDSDTVTINETITHGRIIHRFIESNRVVPSSHYEAVGPFVHSGLGQGLGVALGVKLANPNKTVIALEGDGSFNYNPVLACFGVSQEYNLPFLSIIFDNQSYAAMKQHSKYYPKGWSIKKNIYYGVYMKPKPDYVKIAEAFGGYGEIVNDPSDIKPALQRALNELKKGRLGLLDIILKKP